MRRVYGKKIYCDERASVALCLINVALLRGGLVDYLLAGAWMGPPPALMGDINTK